MVTKKQRDKQIAGVIGAVVLVMLIALFIVGLGMIPDILLFIQSLLGVDEFGSEIIMFIGLIIGIAVLGYKGIEKYG